MEYADLGGFSNRLSQLGIPISLVASYEIHGPSYDSNWSFYSAIHKIKKTKHKFYLLQNFPININ